MIQSALHVAIIMDGNGRWATHRGRPRALGHHAGAKAVRRIVEAAPGLGITTLTLYAFSGDNWSRPPGEVTALMLLFLKYLRSETAAFVANGIRLSVIGRRDRIPPEVRRAISATEAATAAGRALHLRIAIDYSARDAIVAATARAVEAGAGNGARTPPLTRESFARLLGDATHAFEPAADVDLLIRTGAEQRFSDFL
ncbi:MAG: polyprenyl diphosphate synthase, partial [Gemmatimonadales bacterium]|nr:polyprenyl diphosphate synthase [Gemmatimonadales bacterium]